VRTTLVLGLGNSILSDDAVGLHVAAGLQACINQPEVRVCQAEVGGLNLLELLAGYDRIIIIDAIQTRNGTPGDIYRLGWDSLSCTRRTCMTHGIDLAAVIKLGQHLRLAMPKDIIIFAIEARDIQTIGERMSPEVQQAVPLCIEKIRQLLSEEPAVAQPGPA
jgi:hydrogenase maturation protease